MSKSYVVLCMYEQLRHSKKLNINECCNEYRISVSTFHRYLSEIRTFVWEKYNANVDYDVTEKRYVLQDNY